MANLINKQNQISASQSRSRTPKDKNHAKRFQPLQSIIGNRAVQRIMRSRGNANYKESVHSTAAHGTQGSGKPLPFLTQIQRAFGRHDISNARAHEDPHAASAAKDIGASAYTMGHHVAFASSPDLHTAAHESAHIVQQRAGVKLAGNVGQVGDVYERHADAVADRVVSGQSSEGLLNNFASHNHPQSSVVQCNKKVPDKVGPNDYGQFETTKFDPLNDSGVDIILNFHPNKDKADANKIALTQSVKAFNDSGTPYAVNPTIAARMVAGRQGKGYAIDASGATNNPIYFDTKNLGSQDELKNTPDSNVTSGATPQVGTNTHYELGYCYKLNQSDAERTPHSAGISDKPEGIKRKGYGMMFETAALAIDGADKDKYYGSVKWGYKVGGTKANPKVERKDTSDISQASKGKPTANFIEAAKSWNKSTTTGTLEVNPTAGGNTRDAWVQYVNGTTGPTRLPKGTKLKFNRAVKGSTEGLIEADVLNANGPGSVATVQIYVTDVKDLGGGTPNKPLPTK
jgi:hypothetical protein